MTGSTWWLAAYRLALRAFPAGFRGRWGTAMSDTFREGIARAEARGTPGAVRFALRECVNTIGQGLGERLHSDARQLRMLHLQDIRYAGRLLTRSPGFTLLTVLVLAGGLGLSTFTFSFLYTAMYKPLPLGEGDRVVRLMQAADGRVGSLDAVDVGALRLSMQTVQEIGGYAKIEIVMGSEGERRVVDATAADPVMFQVARTPAFVGRTLLPSDREGDAEPVVVLSHRTWEVAFGSDRAVINSLTTINGIRTRVVGVMPPGFGFPVAGEAWVPLSHGEIEATIPGRTYQQVIGRLTPGASAAQAAAEATAIVQRSLASRDTAGRGTREVTMRVESLPSAQFGEERGLVFSVLNLVALLILVLALVNVTNLLLARANERVRETAVRMALGASMPRLVMQGLWESILLCLTGGLVGTAGAAWGLDAITRWTQRNMEGNLAFWWVWQMDRTGLLVTGVFVTVAMAVLGLVVSRRARQTNVREVMQDGTARSGSRREGRLAQALVATQVATVTLLMFFGVMSGIMARRLVNMSPGYETAKLLQAAVEPPADRYETPAARQAVLLQVRERMAEREALTGVLLRTRLAQPGDGDGQVAFRDPRATGAAAPAYVLAMAGAPAVTGISLVEGRLLEAADDASRAPVAVISRSFAAKHWAAASPVGMQVRITTGADTTVWRTIVGVVSDVLYGDPWARDRSAFAVYLPMGQVEVDGAVAFVRYATSEVAGREAIFQGFAAVDPLLMPGQVQPYDEVLAKARLVTVGVSKLFAACFAFALVLAVVGSYGLMSRSIGLRTREIGVRRALGASDAMVTRLLLGQGGRQLGIGAVVAAPLVAVVGAAFNHFFPVGAVPTVAAAVLVPLAVVGVVLAATWVPTRRVLRVAPRDALWRD